MPVSRLYRERMIRWLMRFLRQLRKRQPGIPFCIFVIAAHRELNPDYEKTLSKNFSQLEAIAAFIGRYLLIQSPRGQMVPERNITYIYARIRKVWNDRARHARRQIRSNPYDFVDHTTPSRRNPDGIERRQTYRFLEPERGDPAVDLSQRDIDNSVAGSMQTRDRLDLCRDERAVDLAIQEILQEYGLS